MDHGGHVDIHLVGLSGEIKISISQGIIPRELYLSGQGIIPRELYLSGQFSPVVLALMYWPFGPV